MCGDVKEYISNISWCQRSSVSNLRFNASTDSSFMMQHHTALLFSVELIGRRIYDCPCSEPELSSSELRHQHTLLHTPSHTSRFAILDEGSSFVYMHVPLWGTQTSGLLPLPAQSRRCSLVCCDHDKRCVPCPDISRSALKSRPSQCRFSPSQQFRDPTSMSRLPQWQESTISSISVSAKWLANGWMDQLISRLSINSLKCPRHTHCGSIHMCRLLIPKTE